MFIKINETLYPAAVSGRIADGEWDGRESKAITLEMSYAEANELFVDGLAWSIVEIEEVHAYAENGSYAYDENGKHIMEEQITEYDNSEYNLAGDIIDHRDGTVTVKMGKPTQFEIMEKQLADAVTVEELNTAYKEGVNSL